MGMIVAPDESHEDVIRQLVYIEEAVLQFRFALGESASRMRQMPSSKPSGGYQYKKPELPTLSFDRRPEDDSDEDDDACVLDRQPLQERADQAIAKRRKKPLQLKQTQLQDQGADGEEVTDFVSVRVKRELVAPDGG